MIKDNMVWIALAITLVLVYGISEQEDENDLGINQALKTDFTQAKVPNRTHVIKAVDEPSLLRKEIIDPAINMFEVPSNEQEAISITAMPSAPPVPMNPYIYAGKLLENGEMVVFLTNGQNNYAVKNGDTIDDEWKVKAIHSTEMILLNLATQTQISVQIGALL
jgi:hypothetical protein